MLFGEPPVAGIQKCVDPAPSVDSLLGRSDKSRVQLTYSSGSLKVAPRISHSPGKLAMRISAAITVLMVLASLTVLAQGQAAGRGAPQRGGARGPTTDPKTVITEMQDSLGLLRGLQQQDSVNRIESGAPEGRPPCRARLSAGEIPGQHQYRFQDARRSRGRGANPCRRGQVRGTKTRRAAAPHRCPRWSANGCSISG